MSKPDTYKPKPPAELAKRSPYGDTERRFALGVLAVCDGDSRAAAKALKKQGLSGPSDRTLREWVSGRHAAEYLAFKKDHAAQVLASHQERWDQVSKEATSATMKGLQRLNRGMNDIPLRELPRTVRDTAVAGGVAEDKSIRLAENAPDSATGGRRSIAEIIEALRADALNSRSARRATGHRALTAQP